MSNSQSAAVFMFPSATRIRRQQALRVAADAARLLSAAVAEGNVTLVEHIFAALGAFKSGGALERLEALTFDDAEVLELSAR
jgi:hypothetical protein